VPKDDNIKPLVPLPLEVNLKSGEEDEEILFEARCKLFRYDSAAKENKDRGIGELKV
jgi:E3 SUMO-protein ligase RanBP2